MKSTSITLCIALFLLFFSSQASALKCGGKLVKLGYRTHRILKICGEPDFVDYYDRPLSYHSSQFVEVEIWTYNFGKRKFMQELIFENGRLTKINTLDYGY